MTYPNLTGIDALSVCKEYGEEKRFTSYFLVVTYFGWEWWKKYIKRESEELVQ